MSLCPPRCPSACLGPGLHLRTPVRLARGHCKTLLTPQRPQSPNMISFQCCADLFQVPLDTKIVRDQVPYRKWCMFVQNVRSPLGLAYYTLCHINAASPCYPALLQNKDKPGHVSTNAIFKMPALLWAYLQLWNLEMQRAENTVTFTAGSGPRCVIRGPVPRSGGAARMSCGRRTHVLWEFCPPARPGLLRACGGQARTRFAV